VFDEINIQSHKGEYQVAFDKSGINNLNSSPVKDALYIVDENIYQLYGDRFEKIFADGRIVRIEATEENKSIDKFPDYISSLVAQGIKREQPLVAIGGGITQDITCFLAATMMRGLPWIFFPTTLLAQADSCIGSKSSINSGALKNILGTYTPPNQVVIDVSFLDTLGSDDVFSGVGEMLKVHAIHAPESFDVIAQEYDQIFTDKEVMERFIRDSLLFKKKLIELDEFDQGPRNVMNYGHSFGHAIESATDFGVSHGVAVTIGMDIANFVAAELGISEGHHFERMHDVLEKNSRIAMDVVIDVDKLIEALSKDKKNSATQFRLVLPDREGRIMVDLYDNDDRLRSAITNYFHMVRGE